MLRIHKALIGDPAVCAVYLPFGISKARQIRTCGGGSRTWLISPVRITVRVVGDDAFVRIEDTGCAAEIEAGALELGYAGCAYVENVDTCVVYKDGVEDLGVLAGVTVRPLPTNDPDKPEIPQYASSVFGLRDPPTPLPIIPVPKLEDFWTPMGNPDVCAWRSAMYPDQAELLEKKLRLRDRLDPSMFTGKMRMFMQAVCGTRSVFSRVQTVNIIGRPPVEYLDNYLPIETTNYIIRDSTGDYWMFLNKSRAWRMLFRPCADEAKSKLRAGGLMREEESKLEAVLFSYVYVDQYTQVELDAYYGLRPPEAVLPPPPPSSVDYVWPEATGAPLEHDWHFAYQQPKALRVGHVTIPNPDPTYPIHWRNIAYLEELTFFASDPVDGVPQPPYGTVRLLEQAEWSYMRTYNNIWYSSGVFQYVPVPFGWPADGACDAPVYAFYGASDEHVVVRYTKSDPGTATTPIGSVPYNCDLQPWVEDCGYGSFITYGIPAGSRTGGFYVVRGGDEIWSGVGSSADIADAFEEHRTREGPTGTTVVDMCGAQSGYNDSGTDCAGNPGYYTPGVVIVDHTNFFYTIRSIRKSQSGPTQYVPFSVIMFMTTNPDAILAGSQRGYAGDFTVAETYGTNELVRREDRLYSYFYGSTPPCHYERVSLSTTVQRSFTFCESVGSYWPGAVSQSYTQRDLSRDESVVLITQHHKQTLTNTSIESISVNSGPWTPPVPDGDWYTILRPPGGMSDKSDYPEYRFNARESINGRLWYVSAPGPQPNNVAKTNFAVNNPDDTDIYFIGWA